MPKSNLCQLGRGLQHGLQLAAWRYIKLLHARTACGPILPARGSPRNSLERRVVTASWRCGTGFRTMDDDGRSSSAHMCVCVSICTVHQILYNRRKFRSQTSDSMDRWKAEMGRVRQKRRVEERRSEKRKSQKKEDADARKGRKVAKHCVFPMICGSGGSKSRLAKAAGAEPSGQIREWKIARRCGPIPSGM